MWKLNPFTTPRESTTLEGRYVTIGNKKAYVRSAIAEGGFSCVYLARDAVDTSKQYALKHINCNDGESLESVVKEVSVMKMLNDHPNVVALVAHTILDMGRTKEALLLMEYCDQTLVTVLEKRGAAYFEEKQILSIFRDVCNAVFAMHRQSPPIAHRDLKAENILLGSDGAWKLCDFGSTSTKHKCFDRPEERGVEEDNIRKHTTPAYRAPEMWDLYRKDVINEKVDIWALGCLLYRICYLKSAFDGESKLQILNGNYHIPEAPSYSTFIKQLIKDMLEDSPDARPDITQVWFHVNGKLPLELQKCLPDGPATDFRPYAAKLHDEGVSKKTMTNQKNHQQMQNTTPQSQGRKAGGNPTHAVRTSHHAHDEDVAILSNKANSQIDSHKLTNSNPIGVINKATSQNETFNTFLDDLKTIKLTVVKNANTSRSGMEQDAEVNNLKEQLKQAYLEKGEISLKYEKLCAICHSQRQEIQELKQALAAANPSSQLSKDSSKTQIPPSNLQLATLQPKEKMDGGIWELEQAMFVSTCASSSPSPQPWQAFTDDLEAQPSSHNNQWPTNKAQKNIIKQSASSPNISQAIGLDSDLVYPSPSSHMLRTTNQENNTSQWFGSPDSTKTGSNTPLGWAGF